ncbi:PLDc N-terminal domain-containing protein [Patescibacteria group bacterium]
MALVIIVSLLFIISFLALAFWIWMIVDAASRTNFSSDGEKIAWVLIIIFLSLFGAAVYFFAGYLRLEGSKSAPTKKKSAKRKK